MTAGHHDAQAAGVEFTGALARSWHTYLGPRLLGVYLIGSLAHGGFNRRYSDIDVALVAEDGLSESDLGAMRAAAVTLSPGLASKLSVFWANRNFSVGRFPPLDRLDLLDHAVSLIEVEAARPDRPTLSEIRAYLRGAPFETWSNNAEAFAALETLEPDYHKPYLRAHLYPARFIYSWVTGQIASNDVAVAFLREHRPEGLDVELVARAMQCREEARDPDVLFPDRTALPGQVGACVRMISSE